MEPKIKLLDTEDWYLFRSIQVNGGEFRRFLGFIYYKRPYKNDTSLDDFDTGLLKNVKQTFPNSEWHITTDIFYTLKEESIKKAVTLSESEVITVRLRPTITLEDLPKYNNRYIPLYPLQVMYSGLQSNDEIYKAMIKDYFVSEILIADLEKYRYDVYS